MSRWYDMRSAVTIRASLRVAESASLELSLHVCHADRAEHRGPVPRGPDVPSFVFSEQPLETAIGHEPGDRDDHVERERYPGAHERQRDRRRVEQKRDLSLEVGAQCPR